MKSRKEARAPVNDSSPASDIDVTPEPPKFCQLSEAEQARRNAAAREQARVNQMRVNDDLIAVYATG